jgi:hypothetical protein
MSNDEFNANLKQYSNDRLCEVIVSYRYLGIMRDEAILAMEELAVRRSNGDEFLYEQRIEELMKDLPQINVDLNQIFKQINLTDLMKNIKK